MYGKATPDQRYSVFKNLPQPRDEDWYDEIDWFVRRIDKEMDGKDLASEVIGRFKDKSIPWEMRMADVKAFILATKKEKEE